MKRLARGPPTRSTWIKGSRAVQELLAPTHWQGGSGTINFLLGRLGQRYLVMGTLTPTTDMPAGPVPTQCPRAILPGSCCLGLDRDDLK